MRRFIIISLATVALFFVALLSAHASAPKPRPYDVVSVPCGFTQLPYFIYSSPLTRTETMTLTFQSAGAGLVTFTAQTFQQGGFYSDRTDANCGTCTLVLHNVVGSPSIFSHVQIAAQVSADNCPSSGVTISNFQLERSAAH